MRKKFPKISYLITKVLFYFILFFGARNFDAVNSLRTDADIHRQVDNHTPSIWSSDL